VSENLLVRAYSFGVSLVPGRTNGVQVLGVVLGSVAERAGVKPLDTIVAVNGKPVGTAQEVAQAKVQSVTINRKGTQHTLRVDPAGSAVQPGARAAPTATRSYNYSVPRTTRSARPRTPGYVYRSSPYGADYGYNGYQYSRPRVNIGVGVGGYVYPGYYGFGYGFGRASYYYGGRGFYGGPRYFGRRNGVGIRIGGFGILF